MGTLSHTLEWRAFAMASTLALSGCVAGNISQFTPTAGQEAIVRDGNPALISQKSASIVVVRQAQRERPAGSRPAYVIGILNISPEPLNYVFAETSVFQIDNGQAANELKTFSYEALVREERNKQVFRAIAVGMTAAGDALTASSAGTYNATGTVYGPYGTSHISITGYDPTAATLAQANASARSQAMIANAVETGRRNLDALEGSIIKDSTIFPGEWYGGQLQFEQPTGAPPLSFRIVLRLGPDVHEIDVTQVKPAA